ncbi:MAG TPA: imidazole glycerol phosphate synthase subunit HisH [bacterium]|nr:imidazole glycerol phosphate synthase subunit HisH [bacterium]
MIIVVDYGMGNLRSVSKALEFLGGKVKVSSVPEEILKADKVVLPGVGAFGDGMRELTLRGLAEPLRVFIQSKKPFLGICLGLQLLFPASEESAGSKGLDIFPGEVIKFRSRDVKIPHMGWNQVRQIKEHPFLKGIPAESFFYFVHSFYAKPKNADLVIGLTGYGDEEFASILGTDTALATQFHPEKSQQAGLDLLRNFVQI